MPFTENDKLKEYKINGETMYTIFRQDGISFGSLNTDESKNFRETNIYNDLTDEMIKNRCRTFTDKKKEEHIVKNTSKPEKIEQVISEIKSNAPDKKVNIAEVISRNPSDNLSCLIDSNTLLTAREKGILYSVANNIKTKKNIEEIIKNAINVVEDYEMATSNNTTKAA